MRRADIIKGILEVEAALNQSEINGALFALRRRAATARKEAPKKILYAALRTYSIAAHNYSPAAKYVAENIGLDKLENPETWDEIVSSETAHTLVEVSEAIRFAETFLPRLVPLLEQESAQQYREGSIPKLAGLQVLSTTLYEDKNKYSSPTRVANAIESINHFYYACAMLSNESPSTISVVAFDSGSDKSIDFLGLAKVMECVERILNNIWERVFFYREHQLEERLDLVAKSLPIIAQISQMKSHNEIPPELAEQLNQNIIQGVNKFVQSGVSTPKIENTTDYNPRTLLSPVQRLLVSAPEGRDSLGRSGNNGRTRRGAFRGYIWF